jgi:hypothetical protein
VTSDKQTLILAGEPLPRRGAADADETSSTAGSQLQRLTIIATRSGGATLYLQGEYAANSRSLSDSRQSTTALVSSGALEAQASPRLPAPFASTLPVPATTRGPSSGAAQYARTRDLPDTGTRASFIDTYA